MAEQSFNSDKWLSDYFGELLHEHAVVDPVASDAAVLPPPTSTQDNGGATTAVEHALDKPQAEPTATGLIREQKKAPPVVLPTTTGGASDASAGDQGHTLTELKKNRSEDSAPALKPEREQQSAAREQAALPQLEKSDRKRRVEKLLLDSALKLAPPVLEPAAAVHTTEAPTPLAEVVQVREPVVVAQAQVPAQQGTVQEQSMFLSQPWRNGRPSWAQSEFDVLLFSVSQLTLAVPLISLGKIQKINDELTPLFGQAKWFMGVLPTEQGRIRCVDTALFVMPEKYRPEFRDNYRFIITIDGFPWGLAVDEVKQPIQLQPEAVNWRGKRSQRPWLAGTIRERMCALVDIPKLGELLLAEDKNSTTPSR